MLNRFCSQDTDAVGLLVNVEADARDRAVAQGSLVVLCGVGGDLRMSRVYAPGRHEGQGLVRNVSTLHWKHLVLPVLVF